VDLAIDLLDAAAKRFPIKALCDRIGKAESTLRNELTQQDGYKLGFKTAILILRETRDLRALDRIEEIFGRIAFAIPTCDKTDMIPILRLVGKAMQEVGEHTQAMANALADGRITRAEAETCLRELNDVLASCIELKAHLERYL
jgi:hypothetical protein